MKKNIPGKEKDDAEDIYDVAYNIIIFNGFLKKLCEELKDKKCDQDKILNQGEGIFNNLMNNRTLKKQVIEKTIKINLDESKNIGKILQYLKNITFPSIINILKNNKIFFNEKIYNILLKIMFDSFNYFIIIIEKGMKEIEHLKDQISEDIIESTKNELRKKIEEKDAKTKQINQEKSKEIRNSIEAKKSIYFSTEDNKEKNSERYIKMLEDRYCEDECFIEMLLNEEQDRQKVFDAFESKIQAQSSDIQKLNKRLDNLTQELAKVKKEKNYDNSILNKKIHKINQENEMLKDKVSSLLKEKKDLIEKVNTHTDTIEALNQRISILSDENAVILNENKDLKKLIEDNSNKIGILENENLKTKLELEKKNSLFQNLEKKMAKADIDNKRMSEELELLLKKANGK